MDDNVWGGIDQAKKELKEDIDNLNIGIYNAKGDSFAKESAEDYHRERLRVDRSDIKEDARIKLNLRKQRLAREEQMRKNLKTEKKVRERVGTNMSINDLKERFSSDEYIRSNSSNLIILPALREMFESRKQKIIAGTLAGILAITTLVYGEFQRQSFEEHTSQNTVDNIIPTKEEFEAGLTDEQIAAKREKTQTEEETINKIMNHEEVTPEQIASITTEENFNKDSIIR